ncbi:ABC transporter substrate-binding protein [Sneathiella sp.]|uniref:ABC transporter substrate-binding protein n=1 Tax=Sneathiella sp. TaxID=1964365 RepID=UPI002FE08478
MKFRRSRSLAIAAGVAAGVTLTSMSMGVATASDEVFRFGVPYPETGKFAEYGANYSDGIRLAVQEINDRGGLNINGKNVKVEAIYCDTQANSATAAACGRRLSSQDQVPAMLISTSIETFPIMSFNTTAVPPFLIISSSASNKLVELGNPLVARYWFNTYKYMNGFTKRLKNTLPELGKISIMQSEDEFGKAWADTFSAGWKAAGGEFGQIATYANSSTDFYPQLTALLKEKPDTLAVPGACPQVAPVVKQAIELGFKGPFIFQVSCGPEEAARFASWDSLVGSVFEGSGWDSNSPRVAEFKEAFKAKFGREAVVIATDGYAQAMWLFAAVEAAGGYDSAEKIRAAMAGVMDQEWNVLDIYDLESNGETTAIIHPRVVKGPNDVIDYTDSN